MLAILLLVGLLPAAERIQRSDGTWARPLPQDVDVSAIELSFGVKGGLVWRSQSNFTDAVLAGSETVAPSSRSLSRMACVSEALLPESRRQDNPRLCSSFWSRSNETGSYRMLH